MKTPFYIVTLLTVALAPSPARPQIAAGARIGSAGGTANYMVLEAHARGRAVHNVYLTGAFEVIGGVWACADSPLNAIRCGYDGYSLSLGAAYPLVERRRSFIALTGSSGAFVRTGTYAGREYTGDRHIMVRLGIDGELAILGPIRLQASLAHRRIFDGTYDAAFGHTPNYTGLSVGLSVIAKAKT